jgi:hypothetical protein
MESAMKKLMSVACVLSLVAFGMSRAADVSDWEVYSPEGETFSVKFPGTPAVQNKTEKTPFGNIRMKLYFDQSGSTAYSVVAMELPKAVQAEMAKDLTSALDGAGLGFIKGSGGKLISQKDVKVDGAEGRELEATVLDGASKVRCQVVLTNDRMIMLMVMAPADEDVSAEAAAYFGSFKIKGARKDI